jgi:hypothetical protein
MNKWSLIKCHRCRGAMLEEHSVAACLGWRYACRWNCIGHYWSREINPDDSRLEREKGWGKERRSLFFPAVINM